MAPPVVETSLGSIRGESQGPVRVFKGIPYARPPVGALRFRAPQPAEPWTGVREAISFGPLAPQNPSPLERLLGSAELVHDEAACLTLNVWTPGLDDGRRPVMVWIHGGAFLTGTGSTPWYDGSRFAAHHDVVVVTINYRLGALGFLHLDGLLGEDYAGSGNAGILDQAAALEWVRDNIAGFGGDPGNVTIFGESAGAMSVGTLLALPAARGLFHRAILQSGAGHNALTADQAEAITSDLLARLGLGEGEARRLVEVPLPSLLEAQGAISAAYFSEGLPFEPVVDGSCLPARPIDAVRAGAAAGVDILVGTNAEEWKLFALLDPRLSGLDESGVVDAASRVMAGADVEQAVARYRSNRPDKAPAEVIGAMISDQVFRIPAIRLAEAHDAAGGAARMYLFTWATPVFGGALGSCHALELPFVFDNLDAPGAAAFCGPDAPQSLATAMNAAWASFARGGDPSGGAVADWPLYQPSSRSTVVFDSETSGEDDPMGDERRLWDGLL
ncbi:MAG TPA: carboxylesterase/lipase family protein [Acidimicrobiales bacterium]|nr:carboxylesterase/lipase family protein [Acidimicrobiales bacterium]